MIYEIADLRIDIQNKCRFTTEFCKEYLSEDQNSDVAFSVSVTKEAFEEEKRQSEYPFSDGYIENICLYREICNRLPLYDRFLFHSSVLEYEGYAYAFSGKSGAGKSTHTGLWLENVKGTKILNGDKPILSFENGEFTVHGTPWNGKENRGYRGKAVLKGLCFIEQAKENKIVPLSVSELTDRIFAQLLLPPDVECVEKTLSLADSFVRKVPAYVLECDISEDAVKTSFEALTGKRYQKQ